MPTPASAARPDAIRRHNLGLVLRHIHLDGALTRAELTHRLGVSRSTMGALVAELTQLGHLEEVVPAGGAGVGRPSHVVGPHGSGPFTIAVDFDVTRMVVAAVGIGGTVLTRVRVAPPHGIDHREAAALIADTAMQVVASLDGRARLFGVGVSVPGTVDRRTGRIGIAPNLGWQNAPFGTELTSLLPAGTPVSVANDADLAVLAEYLRGSGRGCEDVVYVLGRTGVGAGLIAGGVPLLGHDGHAGEIGHDIVDESGPSCHCGKRGCVETYVGDGALLAGAGVTGPPTEAAVTAVFDAARAGEPVAGAAVHRVAHSLGRAVAGLVNSLNPQRLLLGGSLSTLLELARPVIEASLEHYALEAAGNTVLLVQPALGDDSLLLGAAELAFAGLLDDPLGANRRLAG